MRGLKIIGDYVTEFLVITVLVALSAFTIIGFIPIIVGVTGYFNQEMGTRRFKDIFKTIKDNWKILIKYTVFQLVILVFPILNVYFFNTHPGSVNKFILVVSYVALFVGVIYLTTAPTVIVNMNVTLKQLLYNGFMMLFGSLIRSVAGVAVIVGVVALILYYPYVVIFTLYVAPLITSTLMRENFFHLKAKALGTSVYELKKKRNEDDYLDEKGAIKRSDENGDKT